MASEEDNKQNDTVTVELLAPPGWTKKKGGTPQRNDIVFISPTGEEIKNRRQLDHYLKSHPRGPAASEFDWGTGDTPRRSARLSEKSKAVVAFPSQSPKKRQRKSIANGAKEKSNTDAEGKATDEKDATTGETKETAENSIVDAKDTMDGEVITEGTGIPKMEDVATKKQTKVVLEESSAVLPPDAGTENSNANVEGSNNVTTVVADTRASKETDSEVPGAKIDESKEGYSEVPDAKNGEPEDASPSEKETPGGKVNGAAAVLDQNNPDEKQAAERPAEEEPLLQETTGS